MGPDFIKEPIADIGRLDQMIDAVLVLIDNHKHELVQNTKYADERELENARLLNRMKNQKNELSQEMNKIMKSMMVKMFFVFFHFTWILDIFRRIISASLTLEKT